MNGSRGRESDDSVIALADDSETAAIDTNSAAQKAYATASPCHLLLLVQKREREGDVDVSRSDVRLDGRIVRGYRRDE